VPWLEPFTGGTSAFVALPQAIPHPSAAYSSLRVGAGRIVPNVDQWRPGDVVVFRAAMISKSLPIVAYQKLVFGSDDAAWWPHVGIYDGQGVVWDAVPKYNVRHRTVAQVLQQERRTLSLRRYPASPIDPQRLAAFLAMQGQNYSATSPVIRRLLLARAGLARTPKVLGINEQDIICSQLVDRALSFAIQGYRTPYIVPLPGDYMHATEFADVATYWCRA
jgi:hypothetical protein